MLAAVLAATALLVVPTLRSLQIVWPASGAEGVASATTVTACLDSGGRWVPNMCLYDGNTRPGPRAPGQAASAERRRVSYANFA